MPKKPDRPISKIIFPASGGFRFDTEPLPVEKEELEQEIVTRFVRAVAATEGDLLRYVGAAPEPGDALLHSKSGEKIYLQLGEVVDLSRIRTNERRAEYGAALWDVFPELREAYAGVQIAIHDAGDVSDLPKIRSALGAKVLRALASEMKACVSIAESLPENAPGELRGKQTFIQCPDLKHPITIRMLRYAPAESRRPLKWLWTGSHPTPEPGLHSGFTALMAKKKLRYGSIRNPFWLVLYSLDCQCHADEESALLSELNKAEHPFDRVYLFFPRHGNPGEARLLYPTSLDSAAKQAPPSNKVLGMFLPEDARPKWDDPRWRTLS